MAPQSTDLLDASFTDDTRDLPCNQMENKSSNIVDTFVIYAVSWQSAKCLVAEVDHP